MSGKRIVEMGRKLKAFIVVISILAGIGVAAMYVMADNVGVGLFFGAVIITIGIVSGLVIGLLIEGFGETVMDIREIRDSLTKKSEPKNAKSNANSPAVIPIDISDSRLRCPLCQSEQHKARDYHCSKCGVKFK